MTVDQQPVPKDNVRAIKPEEDKMKATKTQILSIVQKLKTRGVREDGLDDLVHDVASSLASDTNNGGIESQVEFLLDQGLTLDDILNEVK